MEDVSRVSGRKTLESARETPSLIDVMAISRERVSEVLLDLRKLHGTPDHPLSQQKAARLADVSERDWGRWERGEVTATATSLGKVADAFEIGLDQFDDGKVDHSNTPLADRLVELDQKLDALLVLQGLDPSGDLPEQAAQAAEQVARATASSRRESAQGRGAR